MRVRCGVFIILILISFAANSQKETPKIKFGDVKAEDFNQKIYDLDSNANAVILADIGNTTFEGNKAGWFNYVFKRIVRIKILNKAGFNAATFNIQLYKNKNENETMQDVKGITYNLENGQIIKDNLNSNDIFEEETDKNHTEKKFTLPAVKAGSIIDVTYTVNSPFDFELQPWLFQNIYPTIRSEYSIAIPQLLGYHIVKHGLDSFTEKQNSQTYQRYNITEAGTTAYGGAGSQSMSVSTPVNNYYWAMKNIPALKMENNITTLRNYANELEFQLAATYNGESVNKSFISWDETGKELLRESDFGIALQEDVNASAIDKSVDNPNDKLSTAKNIFNYIRDNFTCTNHNYFYVKSSLQDVVQRHTGNVGEINLLLTNRLRKYGFNADPLILSTRSHGFTYSSIPILQKFNYLICRVNINGDIYYLDASHPNLGFGKLSGECYNGEARLINENAEAINLSADSLKENEVSIAYVTNADKGMSANINTIYGDIQSFNLRNDLATSSKDDYFKNIQNSFSVPAEISNASIDEINNPDKSLSIKYTLQFSAGNDDIIYLTPVLAGALKENPFHAEQRSYPVEMPYCINQTYVLNMETPEGYSIDELPKSERLNLNGSDGMFEYIVGKTENGLQLRCHLVLNKANFNPEDYQTLRDFYAYAVKKEAEQIVFKKNK